MHCPQCRAEYREGFTECADCHVPLLAGAPPAETDPFDPSMELVVLLESNDQIQVSMVKGLLDDAAIPYFVLGQITTLVNDVNPFLHKMVKVQVPKDREAEARALLETLEAPVEEGGEIE